MPMARLAAERIAMAESPLILGVLLIFRMKNDMMTTTGIVNQMGVKLNTVAMAKAPNAVWAKPSPIMEFLRRTRGTPTKAEQIETRRPAIKARCMKEYDNMSKSQFI